MKRGRPSFATDSAIDLAIGIAARQGLFDTRLNRPKKSLPPPEPSASKIIGAIAPEQRPAHWFPIK